MLTLCGFAASNYYNKVKLALLEKQLPFNEELDWLGETDMALSPLGKVPYLRIDDGRGLCESAAMVEYVETLSPSPALLPADAFEAAKVRELCVYLDLHLELVARILYPQAFFGGQVSDSTRERTLAQLDKNVAAFAKLARFSPFVAGASFTLGDCCPTVHLPLGCAASHIVGGRDVLAHPPLREHPARTARRPPGSQVPAGR